jgi:hypothetical protein
MTAKLAGRYISIKCTLFSHLLLLWMKDMFSQENILVGQIPVLAVQLMHLRRLCGSVLRNFLALLLDYRNFPQCYRYSEYKLLLGHFEELLKQRKIAKASFPTTTQR